MLSHNIKLKNFNFSKKNKKIEKLCKKLISEKNEIIFSLKKDYPYSYETKNISKYKKYQNINLIGMGGSILGAKSIYSFLKKKIKKNFVFIDCFDEKKNNKKKSLNLIISKSGNTLETIANANILLKKKSPNIFITENKDNYLMKIAKRLKAEIIHHNNFIGGRYSVMSEVGMLPAELMGLNINKFKNFNYLVKNKSFLNSIVYSVSNILAFIKKKKLNSVILNYDKESNDFFYWYQQLVAESLGKKGKGILPIISEMPRDNHSLMQLYLDGPKNNFYTFFFTKNSSSINLKKKDLLKSHKYLKNKNLSDIKYSQFLATLKVFKEKKIPHRSFIIENRSEETLGELFSFFILETILLCRAMGVNPFNQPAVELIKTNTKKFLINT